MKAVSPLRFAAIGAGFWARFQLAGWREAGGAQCVAICNRTVARAETLAREFGVPAVYADPEEMLRNERLDFVDVLTDVNTHREFVAAAAAHRLPVVCQKPMAPSLAEAERMVALCRDAGVPLLINENWRWQAPIRELKSFLAAGAVGRPFRARIDMITGFPVFRNQPFLRELKEFILTDLGSHTLDTARFLFGEAESLYAQTHRAHTDIAGEDVATVMLRMRSGATVLVEMAYAGNYLEREHYPETLIFVEGESGSVEIAPGYWIRITTAAGTRSWRCPPRRYVWADPTFEVVHASIVGCQAHLLRALRGESPAETTGEDNLKTLALVFGSYESARCGQAVKLPE